MPGTGPESTGKPVSDLHDGGRSMRPMPATESEAAGGSHPPRGGTASDPDRAGGHGVVGPKIAACADDLAETLKAHFTDPVAAWAALRVELDRRMEQPEARGASPAARSAGPGRPGRGTGGPMPTQASPPGRSDHPGAGSDRGRAAGGPPATPVHLPAPTVAAIAARALRAEDLAPAEAPPGQRPFVGFERERAAYARLEPALLARAAGQYVVLVGEEIEGPVDSFEDALRAGWRRFGLGPLYVQQVLAVGPVPAAAGDPSCRS